MKFKYVNSDKVFDYLKRYPVILQVLTESIHLSEKEFDDNTVGYVEVTNNCKSCDSNYVYLNLRQYKHEEDFEDKMDKLNEKLYHYFDHTDGWFMITSDYQPIK